MSSPFFRLNPLASALLCLAAGSAVLLPVHTAQAQTVAVRKSYAISAGPLDAALNQFARHAGVLLSFDPALTAGRSSSGLSGSYGVAEGFATLLNGSRLQAQHQPDGSYTLQPQTTAAAAATPQALPEVRVTATALREQADGPVWGYIAKRSSGGTKTDTALLETPQSISVVTRDQMDAQGAQSLQEVLRYTPGVRTEVFGSSTTQDLYRLRGFSADTYLDGLMQVSGEGGHSNQLDGYMMERVEIVRGPSSVLYGQSRPGGLVNLVSKRPTADMVREVQLQVGSFDRRQLGVDLGGTLDTEGKWLYRITGLERDSGTQIAHVDDDRRALSLGLTWLPNTDTSWTVLANYQQDRTGTLQQSLPAAGTVTPTAYGSISRNTFLGEPDWDHYDRDSNGITSLLSHRLNDTWTLRQNLRYTETQLDSQSIYLDSLDADQRTALRSASVLLRNWRSISADQQAQAEFQTGPVRHTALFGLDYRRHTLDNQGGFADTTPLDIYNPVYGAAVGSVPITTSWVQQLEQVGIYAQDQLRWNGWLATLGARHDHAQGSTSYRTGAATVAQTSSANSYRAALGHVFDSGLMPYVSYSESFEPVSGADRWGTPFLPTRGKQTELGIKYQPANSDALLTASVYNLEQTNVLTTDPSATRYSIQTGRVRSRGADLEAKLRLSKASTVLLAYSLTDTKVLSSNTNNLGMALALVPRHQASLWLDHAFTEPHLQGLTLGLGVRHTGSTWGNAANTVQNPGFTLLDAAIGFDLVRLSPSWRGTKLALNISNLTDKTYVAACTSATGCYWGAERRINATMTYRW